MRTDVSAVEQVLNLLPGTAFSRSYYIPGKKAKPQTIMRTRKSLVTYLTPVVARAKKHRDQDYRIHTTVAYTRGYDVIVTGVIVVEEGDEI